MSLAKTSTTVKERVAHIEENLYHHGLVKIILMEVLQKNKKTWEDFLAENHFMEDGDSVSPALEEEKLAEKP